MSKGDLLNLERGLIVSRGAERLVAVEAVVELTHLAEAAGAEVLL